MDRLLDDEDQDWYELYAPPEKLDATGFRQLRALEDIAVELVTEYADRFWRWERRRWEHDRIEVVPLDEDDSEPRRGLYYPDFIVWLKDGARQHVVFLDPKGLRRFGDRERRKVRLHHEIEEVEKQVRSADPDLYLRAYVLSVTAPALIGESGRSAEEWKRDGVYFLDEADCLKEVVGHALGMTSGA